MNLAPASCCCGCSIDCECLASTYTLAFPAFTWGYNECTAGTCNIVNVTVPATTVTVYRCCYTYEPCGTGGPTTSGVFYRSNPVALSDLSLCCPIVNGNQCVTVNAWAVFAMAAECFLDCDNNTRTFTGWQVQGAVVAENFNGSCEVCSATPRNLSGDACAGFGNIGDYWPHTLFTGTCTSFQGSSVASSNFNPSDPSDPCDPTGTYSVCDTDTGPPCTLTATVS